MNGLETKVPPPVVTLCFALLMWLVSPVVPIINLSEMLRLSLVILVVVLAMFFLLAGAVSFRLAKTTVNPLKPEQATAMVDSGIFRVSRNPMYVGFALFLVAWAVYLQSVWLLVGVILFVLYITRFQILPEERALTALFGDEFIAYQAKVRRWL